MVSFIMKMKFCAEVKLISVCLYCQFLEGKSEVNRQKYSQVTLKRIWNPNWPRTLQSHHHEDAVHLLVNNVLIRK